MKSLLFSIIYLSFLNAQIIDGQLGILTGINYNTISFSENEFYDSEFSSKYGLIYKTKDFSFSALYNSKSISSSDVNKNLTQTFNFISLSPRMYLNFNTIFFFLGSTIDINLNSKYILEYNNRIESGNNIDLNGFSGDEPTRIGVLLGYGFNIKSVSIFFSYNQGVTNSFIDKKSKLSSMELDLVIPIL